MHISERNALLEKARISSRNCSYALHFPGKRSEQMREPQRNSAWQLAAYGPLGSASLRTLAGFAALFCTQPYSASFQPCAMESHSFGHRDAFFYLSRYAY